MRNSENTKQKILSTAQSLFFKQGYDRTSMKDIMNDGKLTKGAIYYHFKSKKEIFEQIMYDIDGNGKTIDFILNNQELSGLEKLQTLVHINLKNKEKAQILSNASSLFLDNKIYGEIIRKNEKFEPLIANIIRLGNKDGSLQVVYEVEMAEQFIQFFNIWIGTQLYGLSEERIHTKIVFYTQFFRDNGMNIINKETSELIYQYVGIFK